MDFYKLEVGSLTQYKYAWAELPDNPVISDTFPKCPKCGRAVGNCYWLEPHDVILKQPRNIGDFTKGVIGCDLIVSEKFKNLYEDNTLDIFFAINLPGNILLTEN